MPIAELEHAIAQLSPENYRAALKFVFYLNDTQQPPKGNARKLGIANGEFEIPEDIDFCNDEVAVLFGVA